VQNFNHFDIGLPPPVLLGQFQRWSQERPLAKVGSTPWRCPWLQGPLYWGAAGTQQSSGGVGNVRECLSAARTRTHNKALITKTIDLNDRGFKIRMLYKDCYW